MNQFIVRGLALTIVLTGSALAEAQEAEPAPPAAAEAAPAEATAAPPAPAAAVAGADTSGTAVDGVRFRFGVSGGAGFFTAADDAGTAKLSCTYFGTDLRLGAQINDLI